MIKINVVYKKLKMNVILVTQPLGRRGFLRIDIPQVKNSVS
jgi:hypothetical protein